MNSGYHVDAAANGAVAWDTLQHNRYDLLITDNQMPKVTGVELIGKLRAARLPLPVIMATGAFPTQPSGSSPPVRPDALLLKPYTAAELLGTVKAVLHTAGGDREPGQPPPNGPGHPSDDGLPPG